MKENLQNLELILATISDGIVVVNQLGVVQYANDSATRIFERGKLLGKDLAVPLYPSDTSQEINLIRRSGIGWAEMRSTPVTWNQQPGYVIGVHDITARKTADLQLHLADTVFDSTREGLMVTDTKLSIVRTNPAFSQITGYSASEVLGKTPAMLHSGRHDNNFYQGMWVSIYTHGHWQGEIWNRRKNGEIYPQLSSIDMVKDATGQVCNYVAVFTDISKLKNTELELDFLAHHDPLTRLPNRLLLLSRLQHGMDMARAEGSHLALLMIDLDRFKDINDSFGHVLGDELLQRVAERLLARVRQVDTVGRFGGDEFSVLMEDVTGAEQASRAANDLIHALSEPYILSSGIEVRIGASVGISVYPENGLTPELILQQADSAVYQAKSEGRGRFAFFSESLTQAARARLDIEVRLRHAITEGELRVYYQPQVDIASGRIVGAEALVRWQSPTEGLISPARFIPIAEATGLIGDIDDWVLRETCLQGQRWRAAGLPPLTLAVNLSAYQFLQGDIGQTVADVLSATAYPAPNLELELTESALMQHETEANETLHRLKALGVRLAIDDFGTGYSSLAYLKLFPLDVLKIDKRFVDDIPLDRNGMEIVTAIIAMGHALRLNVLAEGVEQPEQLNYLRTQGCDQFQGYLTSQPIPAAAFEALLRQHPTDQV